MNRFDKKFGMEVWYIKLTYRNNVYYLKDYKEKQSLRKWTTRIDHAYFWDDKEVCTSIYNKVLKEKQKFAQYGFLLDKKSTII